MRGCRTNASVLVAVGFVAGCGDEVKVEPDFEWHGTRIDIVGFDTHPEETCAGTFRYLDDFADSTASVFGASGHLGIYRWYSPESFAMADPCSHTSVGCTGGNGTFTREMPLEHEVVHLANGRIGPCPSVISEGLAEYYGTTSATPSTWDIMALIMQSEHDQIPAQGYPLAGAFAAHLVEQHGIEAVLRLCELAGPYPSPQAFSEAAKKSFGSSLDQILTEFEDFDCVYSEYRSKHFECSGIPDLVIGNAPGEMELQLDCQSPTTIGPRSDEIWTLGRLRVLTPGVYLAQAFSSTGISIDARVALTDCAACSDSPRTHELVVDDLSDPLQLNARDYAVRATALSDFADIITLRLTPL